MDETVGKARITQDGDGQIVFLPDGFRLPGTEVEVRRSGAGLVLEPVGPRASREEIRAIFAELDRLAELHGDFMPAGREQPPIPPDDDLPALD